MTKDINIRTWSLDGTKSQDITSRVQAKTWSGSYKDCARKLSFDVLADGLAELGGAVQAYQGETTLFSGSIRRRGRGNNSKTFSCVAFDNGLFLKRNSIYLAVRNQTPEEITAELCRQYEVPAGAIAATGVKLNRNFLGTSLYQTIQTLYTLASDITGEQYQIRFAGEKLEVLVKSEVSASLRLIPGSNLLVVNSTESIEDMITRVDLYDDNYNLTGSYESEEGNGALYGIMATAIKASSYDDPAKTARQLLKENGIETTITAECLGNPKLITGNTVVVHEPVTGTDGLFWILSDTHTFKRGIYQTKATLSFRCLMDRVEAGSVPKE